MLWTQVRWIFSVKNDVQLTLKTMPEAILLEGEPEYKRVFYFYRRDMSLSATNNGDQCDMGFSS